MAKELLDINQLKFFRPFHEFTEKQLQFIAKNAKLAAFSARQVVLPLKSSDLNKYFLLDGELKLKAFDGAVTGIKSATENAKNPIAQLRPSRYEVSAKTRSKVIIVEPHIFDKAASYEEVEEPTDSYSINETSFDDQAEEDKIVYDLVMALQSESIVLPSLPDIATRIRKTIEDEDSGAGDIARVIKSDPAIAAKLIKAANSAIYQRRKPVDDCQAAVVGLGTKRTAQLVISYTLKELFSVKNKLLCKRMEELWEHSIEVAAVCFVLAKITPGFDPEEALLAGLIHDIGVIAILDKAVEYPNIGNNMEKLEVIIKKMHSYLSGSILRKWGFRNEMIEAGEEAEYWERDKSPKPDYCDLVNMAHMHVYIGTKMQKEVPRIDQIPAFKKMALGQLTPKLSLKVLDEARSVIDQTKNLLKL